MPGFSGKDLYLSFGGVDISAKQRSVTWDESTDTADTTGGNDAFKNHVITQKDVSGSFEWVMREYASGGSAFLTAVYNGAQGTLIVGPQGTASGKPKYEIYVTITQVTPDYPYDGEVTYSASWQANAADGWTKHAADGDTF